MTDDVRKLLGGYATGTLSDDEKKALFDAAIHDDALFAALADEDALKEILDDSSVRARLLQATEEPRFTVIGSLREWFEAPKSKALVATGAVLLAVIGFQQARQTQNEPKSSITAELRRPTPEQPVAPEAAPQQNPRALIQNEANLDRSPSVSTRRQAPASVATTPNAAAPKAEGAIVGNVEREVDEQKRVAVSQSAPPPPPAAAPAPTIVAPAEKMAAVATESVEVSTGAGFRAATPARASADSSSALRAFERAAGTSVTPLRYELLRRDAAGSFQAVPPDYLFTPGDVVRLRISSTRNGVVGISTNTANTTSAHVVPANTWTEVPQNGGVTITADTARLVVAFAPAEPPTSRLLDSAEVRAKQSGPTPVSLEIPIRQKKP